MRTQKQRVQPTPPPPGMATCQQSAPAADWEGRAYLSMARDDLESAIHWLTLALKGRADWQEALGIKLDALRDVLAALEAEMEAQRAQD